MRKVIIVLLLVAVGITCVANVAQAAPFGPFCFTLLPFPNVFAMFFDTNGGNQFTITGRDIVVGDRAISGAGFLTGPSTFKLGFTLHPNTAGTNFTVGGAVISTVTGSGPGIARAIAGDDFVFTFAIQLSCPPSATSDADVEAHGAAPASGVSLP